MATLTEDDIYRTSTQYRLWSFTLESLASLRAATNSLATESVKAAIRNSQIGNEADNAAEKEIDCLTIEEEQKLVGFYCVKAMQVADFCEFPTNVKVYMDRLAALGQEPTDKNTRLLLFNT